ncbi:hypothetical protein CR105_24430 [Massilia eurypsychrophila]|jgi:tRNA A37 N6-isopentenylltransferase MiaA|uniref:Uncharacterized protein n=1 Tax=Massilia eurypsychrophila TaxID=1485217 RepID=A0A2G8T8Q3_9BURK|nr:hypothetical protein [Massilia eurypsychrophila]PIL42435.1 hypothetical protein CR105_24430 [Massilia eurypsychrophila]
MIKNPAFDASIPVLTEVFQDRPVEKGAQAQPDIPAEVAEEVVDAEPPEVAEMVLESEVAEEVLDAEMTEVAEQILAAEVVDTVEFVEVAEVAQEPPVAAEGEPQWAELEQRISERILTQLHDQIDAMLDQRVRASLEKILEGAVAGITDELRSGLQQSIEKIVTGAVGDELAQLQTPKK